MKNESLISPDDVTKSYIEEIDRQAQKPDEFHNAFDRTPTIDDTFIRGAWDCSLHILAPAAKYLKNPEDKIALEVGYGGGRVLGALAPYFKKAIGIDIHNQASLVDQLLRSRGINNFELLKTDGKKIPVADETIDFVYSFIVLQHLGRLSALKTYLDEIHRVLTPGGCAVLYVGRRSRFSFDRSSRLRLLTDLTLELNPFWKGYDELEINSAVESSLLISRRVMRKLSRAAGFEILDVFSSRRKVPDGIGRFGSQHGFLLRK